MCPRRGSRLVDLRTSGKDEKKGWNSKASRRAGHPGGVKAAQEAGALLVEIGVLLAEAVNAASRIEETLLAGEERMASGADFHMDGFSFSGEEFYLIAAGAGDLGLVHFGMNFFFHGQAPIKSGLSYIYPEVPFGKGFFPEEAFASVSGIPTKIFFIRAIFFLFVVSFMYNV